MATYPKQLQQFDETAPNLRVGRVTEPVMAAGTISGNLTVNDILGILDLHFGGRSLSYKRREPRFRAFDTSFGDTVMFTDGQVITEQAAGQLIDVMRVLWDIQNTRTATRTGLATSVLS